MNFNFQAIDEKFEELEALSAKYSGYQGLTASQIEYHEARCEEDEKRARKIGISFNLFVGLFFIVFAAIAIGTLFMDTGILLKVLMFGIAGIIGYVLSKSIFGKPKVAYGKAIYKQRRLIGHIGSRRSARRYAYLITFIPDNGEKKLYTGVQVSKKDFEQIEEGTPVMVVNKGHQACIL